MRILYGEFSALKPYIFRVLKFFCLANPRSKCCQCFGGFCEIFGGAVRKRFLRVERAFRIAPPVFLGFGLVVEYLWKGRSSGSFLGEWVEYVLS